MKIEGKLDIQIKCDPNSIDDKRDGVELRITDEGAHTVIGTVHVSGNWFMAAMAGHGHVPCMLDIRIDKLSRIGKMCQVEERSFPVVGFCDKAEAAEVALKLCPSGWTPDLNFNSQGSFYEDKDGKRWAKCLVRRWV